MSKMVDFKKLLEEKRWRVVKRKQIISTPLLTDGKLIEVIKEGLTLREATNLRRELSMKEVKSDRDAFYFSCEKMDKINV